MMRAGFERLHSFLTSPTSLLDDPVFLRLKDRIAKARAAHMPTKGLQEALQQYVHSALSPSRGEQRSTTEGGSK